MTEGAFVSKGAVVEVDVRDDLRAGREPFKKIMAAVGALGEEEVLLLRAIFEPVPLYSVLGQLGFQHESRSAAPDDWSIWFWRPSASRSFTHSPGAQQPMSTPPVELDVRAIPPRDKHPSIFRAFDGLASGQSLVLVNDHDPRPLRYQLAAERPDSFDWTYEAEGPELWRVRISRR